MRSYEQFRGVTAEEEAAGDEQQQLQFSHERAASEKAPVS